MVLYLFANGFMKSNNCANVLFRNISVNRVLDRMFSGHFSLNVRTATIGGHVPIQYPNSLQAQPHPMVPSHEGKYTITRGGTTTGAAGAVAPSPPPPNI